jgi:hypothetical protein
MGEVISISWETLLHIYDLDYLMSLKAFASSHTQDVGQQLTKSLKINLATLDALCLE